MSRTKGAKNKKYLLPDGSYGRKSEALGLIAMPLEASTLTPTRSDSEVLALIRERFKVFGILIDGAISGNVRSLIAAGAPGVGKSNLVFKKLEHAVTCGTTQHRVVSGGLSPVALYKLGYEMSRAGSVIVLDDADDILDDPEGLTILKALCDSGEERTVHWLKETDLVDEDGEKVPKSYPFEGTMIFITNRNIQKIIEEGKSRMASHLKALSDRSLYLDLLIHDRQQLGVWVNHIASEGRIFTNEEMTESQGDIIMEYINRNRMQLLNLSLRTIVNACDLMKTADSIGEEFELLANNTLLRRVR